MGGSRAGGLKASKTNRQQFGEDFYAKIGRLGGQVKVKKGFAISGLAIEAGRKGGYTSKRTWTAEQRIAHSKAMTKKENLWRRLLK